MTYLKAITIIAIPLVAFAQEQVAIITKNDIVTDNEKDTKCKEVEICNKKAIVELKNGNKKEAIALFRKSAELGDSAAMTSLAAMIQNDSMNDKIEARSWLIKAAEQNHAPACFLLAMMLRSTKENDESEKWLRAAATLGHKEAKKVLLASLIAQTPPDKCSMDMAKDIGIEANDASVQHAIGIRMLKGNFFETKINALCLLRLAAESGNEFSQIELGKAYSDGVLLTRNEKLAFKYLSSAQAKNKKIASCLLGDCYLRGIGVEKNPTKAYELYKTSSQLGDARGALMAGRMSELGIGCVKDMTAALKLYKKANDGSCTQAAYYLALAYQTGNGVSADAEAALSIYSTIPWFASAQCRMGEIYLTKGSGDENLKKAMNHFSIAANNRSAEGFRKLGQLLLEKTSEKTNRAKAISYLCCAKLLGDNIATLELRKANVTEDEEAAAMPDCDVIMHAIPSQTFPALISAEIQ